MIFGVELENLGKLAFIVKKITMQKTATYLSEYFSIHQMYVAVFLFFYYF